MVIALGSTQFQIAVNRSLGVSYRRGLRDESLFLADSVEKLAC